MESVKVRRALAVAVPVLVVVVACGRENLLDEMKVMVPMHHGACVVEAKEVPEERESIIQFDIEASEASEDDIIEFYKTAMTDRGWEFEELERWAGNGSVFSMTREGYGTLTIQTVTKQVEQTGKIRVVLNLKRE
jgi:hypothetical protein